MATVRIREYVSCVREYEKDIIDADVGELNLHLLERAVEPFDIITCENIVKVYEGEDPLGTVQLKNVPYRTDLNDYVRDWFDDEMWSGDITYESDWETDDVERSGWL